jgi:hypothetical protein
MSWLTSASRPQLEMVADALEELGSIDLQRRRWDGNSQLEMSSFTDAVESLFDDSGLWDEIEKGRSGLAAETVDALRALSTALARVEGDQGPARTIDDPAMNDVRKLANDVLRLLRLERGFPASNAE